MNRPFSRFSGLTNRIAGFCGLLSGVFVVGAAMLCTELPRLKELNSEMQEVQGRLLSTEVRRIPHVGLSTYTLERSENGVEFAEVTGYWCAFGQFQLKSPDPAFGINQPAEGKLSRILEAATETSDAPLHSKADAERDAAAWNVGRTYRGWIYTDHPELFLVERPYDVALKQVYRTLVVATLFGLVFVLRASWRRFTGPPRQQGHLL